MFKYYTLQANVDYMKKALFLAIFSTILVGVAMPVSALSSCAVGDKFDIFTGKECPITPPVQIETESDINILKDKIYTLEELIESLNIQVTILMEKTPTTTTECVTHYNNKYGYADKYHLRSGISC